MGASASVNSPAASSASNFANAVLAEAGSVSGRIPSVEELALRLEARQQLRGLDRPLQRPQLTDGIQTSPEGLRDATPDHPLYGRYLGEWMETNRPDAGRALIGLFRSTLGELRAAISRSSSSGDSARRTAGPS